MNKGITVAVWGSPGSGKTTLSAAPASRLTAACATVLLVGTDKYCPSFAQWYPPLLRENERDPQPLRSLGNTLSVPELTLSHLQQHVYVPKENDKLGLMDYLPHQSCLYSEDVNNGRTMEFLDLAASFAEVTVIDCSGQECDEMSSTCIRASPSPPAPPGGSGTRRSS